MNQKKHNIQKKFTILPKNIHKSYCQQWVRSAQIKSCSLYSIVSLTPLHTCCTLSDVKCAASVQPPRLPMHPTSASKACSSFVPYSRLKAGVGVHKCLALVKRKAELALACSQPPLLGGVPRAVVLEGFKGGYVQGKALSKVSPLRGEGTRSFRPTGEALLKVSPRRGEASNRTSKIKFITVTKAIVEHGGEVFKEAFVDILLSDFEQTAYSFIKPESSTFQNIKYFQNKNTKMSVQQNDTIKELTQANVFNKNFAFTSSLWDERFNNPSKRLNKQILSENSGVSRAYSSSAQKLFGNKIPIKNWKLFFKVGDFVNCGEKIGEYNGRPLVVNTSGKIIKINNTQITLQKTQPVLYYSQANVHVKKNEWVERGAPILTLTHQTLVTGDIVQGIPRIEQLFEAPNSPPLGLQESTNLHETLHSQIRDIFRKNWLKAPLPAAVRRSLQEIQQILVESIQKVYLSQGVLIADKHIEIIVRQMTSKAELIDSGDTGLFLEELLPVQQIENANLTTPGQKALYAPAVVGLTRSALESDSFISAASFQETTRVLSRDALIGKSDFLRGLKEKVVIGDLISAGTGLDIYFVYTLLSNENFLLQKLKPLPIFPL